MVWLPKSCFEKINSKRITDNRYTVVKSNSLKIPNKIQNQIKAY